MTPLLSRPSVALQASGYTLVVSGDLDVNVAAELAATGTKWMKAEKLEMVSFDFTQVDKASSVAISVLFEWLRACRHLAINIESIQLSAPLSRLASLAELDELIANPSVAH